MGFCMVDVDLSQYVVQEDDMGFVIICIYVLDFIVGGDHVADVKHVKSLLKKDFDMKGLGEVHHFLSI